MWPGALDELQAAEKQPSAAASSRRPALLSPNFQDRRPQPIKHRTRVFLREPSWDRSLSVNDANPFKKTQVFLPQTPRMKEPVDPGPVGTLSSPAARWRAVQTAGPSTWPFLRWPGARWTGSIVLGLAGWKAPREKHTAVWIFPGDVHRVRGWRGWAVAGRKATEVFWSCRHCTRPEPHGLRVQFIHLNVSGR